MIVLARADHNTSCKLLKSEFSSCHWSCDKQRIYHVYILTDEVDQRKLSASTRQVRVNRCNANDTSSEAFATGKDKKTIFFLRLQALMRVYFWRPSVNRNTPHRLVIIFS